MAVYSLNSDFREPIVDIFLLSRKGTPRIRSRVVEKAQHVGRQADGADRILAHAMF